MIFTTLLAFDTSTEHLSVAVAAHGQVHTFDGPGGMLASATLIPTVLQLLREAGTTVQALDAIAFGCGPGAFTGLRTACSVAQGLALGAGKPVLPISTLWTVAEDARVGVRAGARAGDEADHRVWALMDARMNEIYAAQYQYQAGAWRELDAPQLLSAEALNQRWQAQPPDRLAGNALDALSPLAAQLQVGQALCLPQALPRARAMLRLAHTLWEQGAAVDAALALPLYLRDKVAQTTQERDAARAAKAVSA
jgi:tRNA threonylcarbamoyladenosine biosynthesis protein TsaB